MAGNTKKVILIIVDGPTDEEALSPVLRKLFQSTQVRFHVVHGDLTSGLLTDNANAVSTVNEHVKIEMDRYGYKRSDIMRIIHLIDTDGAFIPDENVTTGDAEMLRYEEDQIISGHPEKTMERNERKSQVLSRLYPVKKVGGTPYEVYYFSRNLEHVLHGSDQRLTNEQKVDYADTFADKYAEAPEQFVRFLSDSDFAVQGDYGETWRFIFEGTNSLHRHCNLHLLFQGKDTCKQ